MIPIRRALLSVWDKTGVLQFARALHEEFGVELISTGGTARALREGGLPVTLVETLTGAGEMLDGRVKTLHPAIHAGILADRDNPAHMRQLEAAGIEPIDLVVVNLYPFERTIAEPGCTFSQAIEMIDIGGVALLRAAAKNHAHVFVVPDADGLDEVLLYLRGQADDPRARLAQRAFAATAAYDSAIGRWLGAGKGQLDPAAEAGGGAALRYGENPHQSAEVRITDAERAPKPIGDSALSYNNYLDADAALGLCADLVRATTCSPSNKAELCPAAATHGAAVCCFIKHNNPCGVGVYAPASGESAEMAAARREAYRRAYLGDPNAAMGGVLACGFEVDVDFAAFVLQTFDLLGKPMRAAGAVNAPGAFFVEVWVAPSFTPDAVALIRGSWPADRPPIADAPRKKWGETVRLLATGPMSRPPSEARLFRSITGGLLAQSPDTLSLNEDDWRVVTRREPSEAESRDLRLSWLICKHTRSNAITLARDGMLLGAGAGQMSRVMSCRVALWQLAENDPLRCKAGMAAQEAGAVAASDAFFPFPDGPGLLIDAGVTAIIQPGGSKRDAETIALCDERGVAMVFTGARHFRH